LNDEVTVISLKTFTVADHYSKTEADTLLAAKSPIASPVFTGNVLVGTTSTGLNTSSSLEGHNLFPSGYTVHARSGQTVMSLNRLSTDGIIQDFRKGGTVVGSIGTYGNYATIGAVNTGLRFTDAVDAIQPHSMSTNLPTSGVTDLGRSNSQFKDLYLAGGVYVNGTGSANHLDDYEEGTWTPTFGGGMTITYPSTTAKYTKVGTLVTWNCSIQWSGKSGGSGTLTISMPFAANGTGQWQGNANSSYRHGITVASDSSGYMESNSASCYISLAGVNAGNVSVSQMAVGGHLIMGGSYQTT
jgi:hypothetical protein